MMNRKSKLISTVAVLAINLAWAMRALGAGASSIVPLMPIPQSNPPEGFLAAAMHDPIADANGVHSDAEADRVEQFFEEASRDLTRSKGLRQIETIKDLMESALRLTYYWQDALYGLQKSDLSRSDIARRLQNSQSRLLSFAKSYAANAKKPADKARALYYVSASMMVSNPYTTAYVAGFQKIAPMPLPSFHQKRTQLALALAGLESGNDQIGRKSAQSLQQLASSVSSEGRAYIDYRLARFFARKGVANLANQHLQQFTKAAARVEATHRDGILANAVSVWTQVRGQKLDWTKFPISLKQFEGGVVAVAIQERQAIQKWNAKNRGPAIQDYVRIRSQLDENEKAELLTSIDRRIIEWQGILCKELDRPDLYQRAIIAMSREYTDSEKPAMQQYLQAEHRRLAMQEISRAKAANVAMSVRQRSITIAENYRETLEDRTQKDNVTEEIAKVYIAAKDLPRAIAIFETLAADNPGDKEVRYLNAALALQTTVAKWSKEIPWKMVEKGNRNERAYLLGIYEKLASHRQGFDWSIHGQIARLQYDLGSTEEAIKNFEKGINERPSDKNAAHAAGYLVAYFDHDKKWQKLEDTIKLCDSKKIRPVIGGRMISTDEYLVRALYEGGKELYAAQNYSGAKAKFVELTQKFKDAPQAEHGVFLVADCQHQLGEHHDSVATLVGFVERYPNSRWNRAALLNGGDWSASMAYEENALSFYDKFQSRYSKDKEVDRVRAELKELYLGRQLYSDAIRIMNAQLATVSDRSSAAKLKEEIMQIEIRHGNRGRATTLANSLADDKAANDDVKANAIVYLARSEVQGGSYSSLDRREAQLRQLNSASPAVQEALGFILFVRADSLGKSLPKTVVSIALDNPLMTLNKQYSVFGQMRKNYEAVCAVGSSSYCAPAYNQLARVADSMISVVQDTKIAKTLGDHETGPFEARKDQIMEELAQVIEYSQFKAASATEEGMTNPVWVQAVRWEGSNDWHSDRETDSVGGGYSQWQAK